MPRGYPGTRSPHGTLTRLNQGCRCRACKDALNEWRWRTGRARPMAEYLAEVEAAHGTETRARRCDCDECKAAANAARQRRRLENGPGPNAVHGKYSTYSNGCRCDDCRQANTEYSREYKRRKRAAA